MRRSALDTTGRRWGPAGSSMRSRWTSRRRENATRSPVIVGWTRTKTTDKLRLRLNRLLSKKELSVSCQTRKNGIRGSFFTVSVNFVTAFLLFGHFSISFHLVGCVIMNMVDRVIAIRLVATMDVLHRIHRYHQC